MVTWTQSSAGVDSRSIPLYIPDFHHLLHHPISRSSFPTISPKVCLTITHRPCQPNSQHYLCPTLSEISPMKPTNYTTHRLTDKFSDKFTCCIHMPCTYSTSSLTIDSSLPYCQLLNQRTFLQWWCFTWLTVSIIVFLMLRRWRDWSWVILFLSAHVNVGFVVTSDDSSLEVIILLLALDRVEGSHLSQCKRLLQSWLIGKRPFLTGRYGCDLCKWH